MKRTVSDEAVKKATGKTWSQWFLILNKLGAKKMSHTEIAHWLSVNHIPNGWWAQSVTVEYERAFKKRQVNQMAKGFVVTMHKTVPMTVKMLEGKWQKILKRPDVKKRKLVDLKSKTKRKMIRYKTDQGGLVIYFDERARGKSRIMVEAIKLPNKTTVERERLFWRSVLEKALA